jgi:hypothetical protein
VTRRSGQTHQPDFNDALFLAMELSRATWPVATFAPKLVAPRLGNTRESGHVHQICRRDHPSPYR